MKAGYVILSVVVAAIVGLAAGFTYGRYTKAQSCELKAKKQTTAGQAKVIKKAAADIKRADATGAQLERNRAAIESHFEHLEMEAAHAPSNPVDSCVLPADRLRSWRDANAGLSSGDATGKPAGGAEAAAPAEVGRDARPGVEPSGGGEALPPAGSAGVRAVDVPRGE